MRLVRITTRPGNQSWTTPAKSDKRNTSPGRFTPVRDPERIPQPKDPQRELKRIYELDRPMA
jgi:hypothetical protein